MHFITQWALAMLMLCMGSAYLMYYRVLPYSILDRSSNLKLAALASHCSSSCTIVWRTFSTKGTFVFKKEITRLAKGTYSYLIM